MDLRKLDPNFTSWVPKTAAEAIKIFYKRKELGEIIWDDLDLVFKELAQGLDQKEFNIFVKWITNPMCEPVGDLPDCFPPNGMVERENSGHTTLKSLPEEKFPV